MKSLVEFIKESLDIQVNENASVEAILMFLNRWDGECVKICDLPVGTDGNEFAKELADELNCAVQSIYFVCNHKTNKDGSYRKSVKGKHILWLYEYEYMSEREIKEWADKNKEHIKKENKNVKNKKSKKYRKVICVTTEKVFLSLSDGGRYYNCNYNHISGCCRGKEEYCGKLSDGTKLQWKYIDDLTEEEYIKYDIENKIKELNKQKGLIICF